VGFQKEKKKSGSNTASKIKEVRPIRELGRELQSFKGEKSALS